jgi:hypothetical protein
MAASGRSLSSTTRETRAQRFDSAAHRTNGIRRGNRSASAVTPLPGWAGEPQTILAITRAPRGSWQLLEILLLTQTGRRPVRT